MRRWFLAVIVLTAVIPSAVFAQGTSPVITAPIAGQTLHGQVSITGSTDVPNFASAELDFAYASDSTGTWFLIQTFSQPITNSAIATWDTTTISDGDYVLRLRVILQDGSFQDATVKVKVQNESPTATMTPTAIIPTITFTPKPATAVPESTLVQASPTATAPPIFSTPTAFPVNPAEVQTSDIYAGIRRGALIIVVLFIFFGIVIRIRRS